MTDRLSAAETWRIAENVQRRVPHQSMVIVVGEVTHLLSSSSFNTGSVSLDKAHFMAAIADAAVMRLAEK